MSDVTLSIAGRNYTVSCADGEEAHVRALGELIQAKLGEMGGASGQTEARSLLFAALLLADEVHEHRHRAPKAQPAPAPAPEQSAEQADALEAIARRLENCAMLLERRPVAS